MRILGFEISRRKTALPPVLSPPARGWSRVVESYPGAWQAGVEVNTQDVAKYGPVFACMSLIASDIAKLRPRLLRKQDDVWREENNARPLLRNPNSFQNFQQFLSDWVYSLLRTGNTYVWMEGDSRNVATGMNVLNPERVQPLITPRGDVYYKIQADNIVGLDEEIVVPAREIIHDRINTLYHPLCGVSPLWAAGLAAQAGSNISKHTTAFFAAMARPSGILTAPGHISDDSAQRLKEAFDDFRGTNAGSIAVVGDGLKFEQLAINSTDAQLLEMLKLTAEQVATVFKIPAFMIGAAPPPSVNNAELLQTQYFRSCLQSLIEGIENGLNAGFELDDNTRIELDVEGGLLRLDTSARYASYEVALRSGWAAPNEVRRKENLPPVTGGDTPYLQQQNYSLEALARRDESPAPFAPAALPAPTAPAAPPEPTKSAPQAVQTPAEDFFPGLIRRGAWDANRGYEVNDAVLFDGRWWKCVKRCGRASEPGEHYRGRPQHWEELGTKSQPVQKGDHFPGLIRRGVFDVTRTYQPNDAVQFGGKWWRCTDHVEGRDYPPGEEDVDVWEQIKTMPDAAQPPPRPPHAIGEIVDWGGRQFKCVAENRYRAVEAEA